MHKTYKITKDTAITLLRGSCTSKEFTHPECPSYCLYAQENQDDTYGNIEKCSGSLETFMCLPDDKPGGECRDGPNRIILAGGM